MKIKKFKIELSTGRGPYFISVFARDAATAKKMIMEAENCPLQAIKQIKEVKK